MLVLSRRVGERLVIGDDIVVTVIEVRSDGVRLGIDAPRSVAVHRAEVLEAVTAANVAATDAGDDAVESLRTLLVPTRAADGSAQDAPAPSGTAQDAAAHAEPAEAAADGVAPQPGAPGAPAASTADAPRTARPAPRAPGQGPRRRPQR